MELFLSVGNPVEYITSEGVKSGVINGVTLFNGKLYYRLDNGDYILQSHFGPVKTYESDKLNKAFAKRIGKQRTGTVT
jgi:hypothetical protein